MIQTTFGRFETSVDRPRNTPTNANNTRANSNPDRIVTIIQLAEGERFELSLGLPLSLISSQVPSTTQPPFHSFVCNNLQSFKTLRFDNVILQSDTACVKQKKKQSSAAKPGKLWQKTQYSNLLRYVPSETY